MLNDIFDVLWSILGQNQDQSKYRYIYREHASLQYMYIELIFFNNVLHCIQALTNKDVKNMK